MENGAEFVYDFRFQMYSQYSVHLINQFCFNGQIGREPESGEHHSGCLADGGEKRSEDTESPSAGHHQRPGMKPGETWMGSFQNCMCLCDVITWNLCVLHRRCYPLTRA